MLIRRSPRKLKGSSAPSPRKEKTYPQASTVNLGIRNENEDKDGNARCFLDLSNQSFSTRYDNLFPSASCSDLNVSREEYETQDNLFDGERKTSDCEVPCE